MYIFLENSILSNKVVIGNKPVLSVSKNIIEEKNIIFFVACDNVLCCVVNDLIDMIYIDDKIE